MTICDICESKTAIIQNYRFEITIDAGNEIKEYKGIDLCQNCYANIQREWKELFIPLPKLEKR